MADDAAYQNNYTQVVPVVEDPQKQIDTCFDMTKRTMV